MYKNKKILRGGENSKNNLNRYFLRLDETYGLLRKSNYSRWNKLRINSRIKDFLSLFIKIFKVYFRFFNFEDYVYYYNVLDNLFYKYNIILKTFRNYIQSNKDLINLIDTVYSQILKEFTLYSNHITSEFIKQVNDAIRKLFNISEPERCRNGYGAPVYCNPTNTRRIDPSSINMSGMVIKLPTDKNMKYIKNLLDIHLKLINLLYGYSLNIPKINKNFADIKKRYSRYIVYLQTKNHKTYENFAKNRLLFKNREKKSLDFSMYY
jgi:hypothetical protein